MNSEQLVAVLFKDPVDAYRSQGFGYTSFAIGNYLYNFHTGVDLTKAVKNTLIIAPCDLEIIRDDDGRGTGGYGNQLIGKFKAKDGLWYCMRFAHFEKNFFRVGDSVKSGDVVGIMGLTGFSTGPHLHFEIYKGLVNPYEYQNNKDLFLSKFVNPMQLDTLIETVDLDVMINQELLKENQQLKAERAQLIDVMAVALNRGDNYEEVRKYVNNLVWNKTSEHINKRGILTEFYKLFLGREPDEEGLAFWATRPPLDFLRALPYTEEYNRRILDIIYTAALGRLVDPSGLKTYTGRDPLEVAAAVRESDEFKDQCSTGGTKNVE